MRFLRKYELSIVIIAVLAAVFGEVDSIEAGAKERNALAFADYKSAIRSKQEQIAAVGLSEKSRHLVELAILFLKDQEQEKAFSTYLQALDAVPVKTSGSDDASVSDGTYCDALAIYFDHQSGTPKEKAQKIYNKYYSVVKEKCDVDLLTYIVAISLANLGRYDDFFELFYRSYQSLPNHFLAYKTKAILHIKLYERARTEKEREQQGELIQKNLELALAREPKDDTLYKLMITFSLQKNKTQQVRRCLNKIFDDNIILPRGDILFFVQEAVDVGEYKLAQSFIEKSRTWYPQSKIITSAQAYLDAHLPKE